MAGHSPLAGGAAVELLLLRHAPTAWNEQRRRQGWVDQPLTPAARANVAGWAARCGLAVDAVTSSDLSRARETAQIASHCLGVALLDPLPGLREQRMGQWTGLTREQIKRQWPDRWRQRPRRPAGGEEPEALLARVLEALRGLTAACPGGRLLVVTHSGVIRALERELGADAPPVPHLEGRWLAYGPPDGCVTAGPPTAGRHAPEPAEVAP